VRGAWCVVREDRRQETGFRRERQPNGDRSHLISSADSAPLQLCPSATLQLNYELRINAMCDLRLRNKFIELKRITVMAIQPEANGMS
jgi:hypothetical protein